MGKVKANSVYLKLDTKYHDRYLGYCTEVGATKTDFLRYLLDVTHQIKQSSDDPNALSNGYKHWLRSRR